MELSYGSFKQSSIREENNKEEEMDLVTSQNEEKDEEEEMELDTSHGSVDKENEEEEMEIPAEKHYTQCRRLYHCIHAVVAKIAERDDTKQEWATRRVKLLLDLIPNNPDFPLSEYQLVSLYGN